MTPSCQTVPPAPRRLSPLRESGITHIRHIARWMNGWDTPVETGWSSPPVRLAGVAHRRAVRGGSSPGSTGRSVRSFGALEPILPGCRFAAGPTRAPLVDTDAARYSLRGAQ
jgi:hypothetical protein